MLQITATIIISIVIEGTLLLRYRYHRHCRLMLIQLFITIPIVMIYFPKKIDGFCIALRKRGIDSINNYDANDLDSIGESNLPKRMKLHGAKFF